MTAIRTIIARALVRLAAGIAPMPLSNDIQTALRGGGSGGGGGPAEPA